MVANFRKDDQNKIIITGADRAEALLIKQLVVDSKEATKFIELKEFFDIEGDVNGISIELKDIPIEPTEPTEGE